ncbi:hypothetical protein PLESTB_001186900 [Pleodorina starrii]|uniref:Uncharacterized protein n=1 Tax=Pleodorina starrii TaxID=330485 RepID=A0A9W6F5E9_9CHLO|nr:hypothetical protein PLESTB_001186900 [Pleodorina starrii]
MAVTAKLVSEHRGSTLQGVDDSRCSSGSENTSSPRSDSSGGSAGAPPPSPSSRPHSSFVFRSEAGDTGADADDPEPAPKRRTLITDSTGDLVLPRRRRRRQRRRRRPPHPPPLHISIRHTGQPTPVADVGLQVWRGACLACDWLLTQPDPPPDTLVLELGGGVGLVGVAAAALCRHVVLTDVHGGALSLAAANLAANAGLVRQLRQQRLLRDDVAAGATAAAAAGGCGGGVRVDVCQLDWFDFLAYGSGFVTVEDIVRALREGASADGGGGDGGGGGDQQLTTTAGEVEGELGGDGALTVTCGGGVARVLDALAAAEVLWLIAADTVYDTVLTEAFAKCAAALMSYHASVRRARFGADSSRALERGAADGDGDGAGCAGSGEGGGGSSGGSRRDGARLIVALEKRINFVLKDLAARAPAFEDFMSYVVVEPPTREGGSGGGGGGNGGGGGASLTGGVSGPAAAEGMPQPQRAAAAAAAAAAAGDDDGEEGDSGNGATAAAVTTAATATATAALGQQRPPLFRGRRLDVDAVPQVLQYERCNQLELWELTLL